MKIYSKMISKNEKLRLTRLGAWFALSFPESWTPDPLLGDRSGAFRELGKDDFFLGICGGGRTVLFQLEDKILIKFVKCHTINVLRIN
jgi:hypothetical protein